MKSALLALVFLAGLAPLLGGACGRPSEPEPLEVTYYYLPD
jgi:hypothetical protein